MSSQDDELPLTKEEMTALATFNSEVARGLVHRPGYAYTMAELQTRYNDWIAALNDRSGYTAWRDTRPVPTGISAPSPAVTGGGSDAAE